MRGFEGDSLTLTGTHCELQARRWSSAPGGAAPRGRVVVVHGYGEHGGRYRETAAALAGHGWGVLSYDQRGHGQSPGRRGVLRRFDDLVDDLHAVVDQAPEYLPSGGPTVVLGHSMGGLVAVRFVQTRRPRLGGVILSAPWLGPVLGMAWWQRLLSRFLVRLAPDLAISSPLDPTVLTRDPGEAARRSADPLVHDKASAGLMARVEAVRGAALAEPLPEGLPVLVLVPGDDRLLDQGPTLRWARRHPPEQLRLAELPGRRHEPLNDVGRRRVRRLVADWLESEVAGG